MWIQPKWIDIRYVQALLGAINWGQMYMWLFGIY